MSHNRRKQDKIRKIWFFNPTERVHSSPKGKKGYNRNDFKKDWKQERD